MRSVKDSSKDIMIFSSDEIPPAAKPVAFAQNLSIAVFLSCLGILTILEASIDWLLLVMLPCVGYYAFTIYKTGYVVSRSNVYSRKKSPVAYQFYFLISLLLC